MESAGQHRIVRAEDVAHMGITEVLRHAPYIFTQYRKLVASLKRDQPSIAVLIDFPDVNFRLAKHCRRLGIPVLWFVSPQLWAWKRRRLSWVQQRVDRMLTIFPFEAPFYRNRHVDATFVGHPLATLPIPTLSREAYAAENGLDPTKQWIALLPGSRKKELHTNVPEMVVAAALLGKTYEYLVPIASTVTQGDIHEAVDYGGRIDPRNYPAYPGPFCFVPDARLALHHARASIVASGTATVQALTVGNPFVVVYQVSPLTFAIAKHLVRYPPEIPAEPDADGNLPIAMPNLIAGRRIVPELLNHRFTAQNLAATLRPLLDDTPARAQMLADLAETRAKLLPPPQADGQPANPIAAVCDAIQSLLQPTTGN
jgi:lipid-A-disaccharide synthase